MPLTALLIGSNSLTVECGNRWLERGHSLAAVVTREAKVAAWAAERSLRIVAPGPGLANRLAGTDVDWVLSVANLSLVPDAVLALAGQGGVNFHDGPLPGYAGLNAPVWAILNGEPTHAVTWHLLTAGIDDGDVLACRDFPVEPDDTAFTLNTRCFAAGLDSFADVMPALEAGGHPRQPQPVGPRRMWRRADRPWAAGRLDFGKPAAEVARTVRALDHSGYRNPIAVPKIDVSGTVFAVSGAEAVTESGTAGDVLGATDDTLTVACAEGAVRLTGLRRMDGALGGGGGGVGGVGGGVGGVGAAGLAAEGGTDDGSLRPSTLSRSSGSSTRVGVGCASSLGRRGGRGGGENSDEPESGIGSSNWRSKPTF